MTRKTRRREEADRVLLSEGPKPVDEIVLLMMRYINPGEAARIVEYHRQWNRKRRKYKTVRSSRRDIYESGRRAIAMNTLRGTVYQGAWIRTDDMIRHRDWVGQELIERQEDNDQ